MVSIEGKSLGSKRPLFDHFSIALQDLQVHNTPITLNDLLDNVVTNQVKVFSQRQHESQLLKVLTQRDIESGTQLGKITSGASHVPKQAVDLQQAIVTAKEAFVDGLFMVFIDEEQITELETNISLTEDSRILFIRLTLIAGG